MGSYINFKKSNCKDCYKCIRNCPVKSIRFSSHQAQIIEDECILCGKCFVSCPQNAKEIRNDLSKVRDLIIFMVDKNMKIINSCDGIVKQSTIDDLIKASSDFKRKEIIYSILNLKILNESNVSYVYCSIISTIVEKILRDLDVAMIFPKFSIFGILQNSSSTRATGTFSFPSA